jgi:hypothetical protein
MTDDKATWISLCVGSIIAVAALLGTAQFASECHASGGTMVRGVVWWVCIR